MISLQRMLVDPLVSLAPKIATKIHTHLNSKFKDIHIKELILGCSTAFAFRILGMLIGYIFIFIVSNYYGTKGVGIYTLSITVLVILGFIGTMGFNTSVVRFVAQFSAENKPYKIKVLYKNVLKLITPFSVLISICLYIFADQIAVLVFHDSSLSTALKILSFSLVPLVINQVNTEVIRGLKDIRFSEYIRNLNVQLFNIFVLILISIFFASYYIPVFSYSFAIIISCLVSTWFLQRKFRYFAKAFENILSQKELIKVSWPMMLISFMQLFMGQIDTIMLGIFSSIDNVGIYSIAFKLASFTTLFLYAINTIVAPKFSELYWLNKIVDLKRVVRFSSKLLFWTSAPFLLLLITLPEVFLGLFGSEFKIGKFALVFLAIGQFINCSSGSVGYFLSMTGRQDILRNIVLIALLINITLNYIMIPKYGVTGAAMATMISMVLWNIASVVYIDLRYKIKTCYIPFV